MLKMIGDATESQKKRGLDWKEDQMELTSCGLDGNIGDLKVEGGGKENTIKEGGFPENYGNARHNGN